MKRGAEKQLSKDDNPDDDVEEIQTGFQIARDSDLARREIRGLPKRRSPAIAPASTPGTTQPAAPQKFGSFSGFGASTGGITPFTFASSPLAGPPQKPADAPTVSESASNATKKFASFLGPSSTTGAMPAVSSSETPRQDTSGDTDEVALKYYISLRGLNSSFLSVISKAIESDPFVDVADLLEQYKNHRVTVQQDYDGKSSHAKTRSAPSPPPSKTSVPAAPVSFLKPPTSTPATMPAPPSSFSSFGPFSSSAAPATGITPGPAAPTADPSPFSLSSAAFASSDSKPVSAASPTPFSGFGTVSSSSPFKPTASHTSKEAESTPSLNPPSFGAFASTGTSSAFSLGSGGTSLPSTSTLLFGNPPKTSTLFGSDKAAPEEKEEKDKPTSSAPSPGLFGFSLAPGAKLFGDATTSLSGSSNIFGASTTMRSAEEKDNKEKDKPAAATPPSSTFGSPFGVPSKASPFTFGSTASATTPAQFGFGVSPGGVKGASPPPTKAGSVGFSFGSPSRTGTSSSQATTSTGAPGSIFGFGSTTSTSASGAAAPAGGTAESTPTSTNASTPAPASAVHALLDGSSSAASRGETPATEGSLEEDGLARTQSPGLHGGEGEGEEDEETTYSIKAKVFKFTTDREGAPTWSDMGIGMLRLKKHKETNARRVILRSNTTEKIIINFRIYAGLRPKQTGKTVAFTGHITSPEKDTQSVQYRLRVVTEVAATELAEAIEREVRLVRTNSSPST